VMPDCAAQILGKIKLGEPIPVMPPSERRWRVKSDFPGEKLAARRQEIRERASEQKVDTFVADEWTLEYDLAFFGLGEEVWTSTVLAANDERIHKGKVTFKAISKEAKDSYDAMVALKETSEVLASKIYAPLGKASGVSKPVTAQYLAHLLDASLNDGSLTAGTLRESLPKYLVAAIEYVTEPFPVSEPLPNNPNAQVEPADAPVEKA
jgi:putative ATP-dependent endonuclease of OLD family